VVKSFEGAGRSYSEGDYARKDQVEENASSLSYLILKTFLCNVNGCFLAIYNCTDH